MFDEKLSSTTDRDLSIRLCDDIDHRENIFASTRKYTVVHYADQNISRVSTKGSQKKAQGLQRFYYKHAPRMDEEDRKLFKQRAAKLFGCGKEMFSTQSTVRNSGLTLQSWSGDKLKLNKGTYEMLPSLNTSGNYIHKKKEVLFGIISSDIKRLEKLLGDISKAAGSPLTCFNAFIVVLSNSIDLEFPNQVYKTFDKNNVCGYVLERSNIIVDTIIKNGSHGSLDLPFPICQSRTILQVFTVMISKFLSPCFL